MPYKHNILVIATSRETRGGITSVVKAHQKGRHWDDFHCEWIETHIDKGAVYKFGYLLLGFMKFLFLLPGTKIVHIHLSEPISAIRKCPFLFLAKVFRKKTIVHFHSFSPETTISGKYRSVYKYLFSSANIVIVLSDFWKKAVDKEFNLIGKTEILYNPCTTIVSIEKYSKKNEILYAGTINKRKGYDDLIKAFALIADKYPDWKLVFAGNGNISEGKFLASEYGICNQVIFLGWVTGEDKDRVFKESTIFCLPSYAEGFPMSVLDAWAYKLPVITTPVGGITDVAKDGENILLFEPSDFLELSRLIELLIVDSALRDRLICGALELSGSTFNIDVINEKLYCLYMKLLNS